MKKYGLGIKKACRICCVNRSVYYYKSIVKDKDSKIKEKLEELAEKHIRWGFRKMYDKLKNEGYRWNHKRIYRIYCDMKLNCNYSALLKNTK
jgi:putative transposase